MKRILLTLLIICFAIPAYAGPSSSAITTGEQSGNTLVFSGSAKLTAVHIVTDGTNDGKIIIHDDVSIGAGAIIGPGVEISEGVLIGMGAVVTKDLRTGVHIGVPARRMVET